MTVLVYRADWDSEAVRLEVYDGPCLDPNKTRTKLRYELEPNRDQYGRVIYTMAHICQDPTQHYEVVQCRELT